MASRTLVGTAGDDLFRIAARLYRDAMGASILMRANNLSDPILQSDMLLVIPSYNAGRANDGITATQ